MAKSVKSAASQAATLTLFVIADGSFDEVFSNNPIEGLSADVDSKQKSPVHDVFDPELIADATADCAPDSIQFTGKLRARLIECPPPKTSNDEDGKDPSNKDRKDIPNSSNGNNGNGKVDGHQPLKYPEKFIWQPPPPPPVLIPPASNLCPPIKSRFNVINPYLICHEGFDIEIHNGGEWIQNALWCDDSFLCFGTQWCCTGFWQLRFKEIRGSLQPIGDGYSCLPLEDGFYNFQIPAPGP